MKLQNQPSHGIHTDKTDRSILEIREFLCAYPGMAIKPNPGSDIILCGNFEFSTKYEKYERIIDSFRLEIRIPPQYPKKLPNVREIGNRIPHKPEYHVNNDGSLCLGSPLRLLLIISKNPSLCKFVEKCLEPYLYTISYKIKIGDLPYSELEHGLAGEMKDYAELFGLKTAEQAKYAIYLLGKKKRLANKKICPCGCNTRLGKCKFNFVLREFRRLAERSWFRVLISNEDFSKYLNR